MAGSAIGATRNRNQFPKNVGSADALSPSDIIAWSWSAVSPTLGPAFTVTGSSMDAGSQVMFDALIATPTDPEIPLPAFLPYQDSNANLLTRR